jgi:Ni/Fe-hydrogenase subunit HybB-like protein
MNWENTAPRSAASAAPPLLSAGMIDDEVLSISEHKPPRSWYAALLITGMVMLAGLYFIGLTVYTGIGVWGNNSPVFWAFDITNFVFWIGIGHAGTLISAIFFLFRQRWRNAVARFAEAMTIFAVIVAGLFPLIHTGRPWLAAYWLFPYPNKRSLWINFTSPLIWDVFAVSTYFTVSLLFWYTGLIPDLASMRDRCPAGSRKTLLRIFSLGWSGSARNWLHFEKAYLILAGLSTPLVLSVHSVVSFDFAVSVLPGWHSTIFPPYFVTGAIFSGLAMVLTVLVISRRVLRLESLITIDHLDTLSKLILTTSLIVSLSYLTEFFMSWYSADEFERFMVINRATGHYWWAFWLMLICNMIIPQVFWFARARRSVSLMLIVGVMVNVGMWFERFVIIVTSLERDFVPSAWHDYRPTHVDLGVLAGSFGIFFTAILIFARLLPIISTSEVKEILNGAQPVSHSGGSHE